MKSIGNKSVIISSKYDEMSNMTKCRNIESKVIKKFGEISHSDESKIVKTFDKIGRCGEIGHFDEIAKKSRLLKNRTQQYALVWPQINSIKLFWGHLQPFCNTLLRLIESKIIKKFDEIVKK